MSNSVETVRRLGKNELRTREYLELAAALFGSEGLGERLRYWDWLYGENPSADSKDILPIFCYWADDYHPVGQLGIIPETIVWNGERQRAGWCIDFHILKDFQRRGIGGKLLAAAHASFPLLMTLGQTEASRGLFLKENWHCGEPLIRYRKFLNPALALAKKAVAKVVSSGAAKRYLSSTSRSEVEGVGLKGELQRIDLLSLQKECMSQRARIWRDGDFLVWRYAMHPTHSYEVQRFAAGQGQMAYVIWRFVQRDLFYSAVVQEVLYPSDVAPSILRGWLDELTQRARQRGAEVLECQTSDTSILDALPRGLVSRDSGARFLYGSQSMPDCPFFETREWRLFAGDCDVDLMS